MKKGISIFLVALFFASVTLSSCASRGPKCPGVYSDTDPIVKVKHV